MARKKSRGFNEVLISIKELDIVSESLSVGRAAVESALDLVT